MLKTLRITSLIALVLAASGVVLIVIMGLRSDAEIVALLKTPGIADRFQKKSGDAEDDNKADSPFITQAKGFALRIDPPPPPKPKDPPKPKTPPKTVETARQAPKPKPVQPRPKGPVNAKFTLLATVVCETNPEKSLALLQTSPTKQEWFWLGQRVGHLDIEEIRSGSVVFSQNGRNQQELFVPVKKQPKSILKADQASATRPAGPGSINVLLDPSGTDPSQGQIGPTGTSGTTATMTESGTIRMARPQTPTQREVPSRISRIRSIPKPPTPEEQKATIQDNVSRIQEIMTDEDTLGLSEEEQAAQKESWKKLIELLQAEKEMIDKGQQQPTPDSTTSPVVPTRRPPLMRTPAKRPADAPAAETPEGAAGGSPSESPESPGTPESPDDKGTSNRDPKRRQPAAPKEE